MPMSVLVIVLGLWTCASCQYDKESLGNQCTLNCMFSFAAKYGTERMIPGVAVHMLEVFGSSNKLETLCRDRNEVLKCASSCYNSKGKAVLLKPLRKGLEYFCDTHYKDFTEVHSSCMDLMATSKDTCTASCSVEDTLKSVCSKGICIHDCFLERMDTVCSDRKLGELQVEWVINNQLKSLQILAKENEAPYPTECDDLIRQYNTATTEATGTAPRAFKFGRRSFIIMPYYRN